MNEKMNELEQALKKLGISLRNCDEEFKSTYEVLNEISQKWNNSFRKRNRLKIIIKNFFRRF